MLDEDFKGLLMSQSDKQLIDSINQGESTFQEGYYSFYLDEAKRRNLVISINETSNISQKKNFKFVFPRIFIAWIIFVILFLISQVIISSISLLLIGKHIIYGDEPTLVIIGKVTTYVISFIFCFVSYFVSIKWLQRTKT